MGLVWDKTWSWVPTYVGWQRCNSLHYYGYLLGACISMMPVSSSKAKIYLCGTLDWCQPLDQRFTCKHFYPRNWVEEPLQWSETANLCPHIQNTIVSCTDRFDHGCGFGLVNMSQSTNIATSESHSYQNICALTETNIFLKKFTDCLKAWFNHKPWNIYTHLLLIQHLVLGLQTCFPTGIHYITFYVYFSHGNWLQIWKSSGIFKILTVAWNTVGTILLIKWYQTYSYELKDVIFPLPLFVCFIWHFHLFYRYSYTWFIFPSRMFVSTFLSQFPCFLFTV